MVLPGLPGISSAYSHIELLRLLGPEHGFASNASVSFWFPFEPPKKNVVDTPKQAALRIRPWLRLTGPLCGSPGYDMCCRFWPPFLALKSEYPFLPFAEDVLPLLVLREPDRVERVQS